MPTRPSPLQQFKPPTPLAGKLSVQSVLFAVGDGAFITASAAFFLVVVGLSPAQVGIGITVAGVASFLVAVPAGKLADRIGPQRLWAIGAVGTAATYATWPWIDGFVAFLVVSVVLEVVNSTGGAARGAYVLDVLPRAERIGSQAYMYAATNLGFTLGAGLSFVALAFEGDTLLTALPLLTAALSLVNGYWITRLPKAPHKERPSPLETAITAAVDETDAPRDRARRAAQPRLPADLVLQRRADDQPGAAAHGDPAVAALRDRRPAGAAGGALRHQHADVHRAADDRGPHRARTCRPRCAAPGSAARSSCWPA